MTVTPSRGVTFATVAGDPLAHLEIEDGVITVITIDVDNMQVKPGFVTLTVHNLMIGEFGRTSRYAIHRYNWRSQSSGQGPGCGAL